MIKNIIVYIFLLFMFLISFETAAATNISVHPGDNIQSAVNKASDGDTLVVYAYKNASYTYKGSVVLNKKLFIRSYGSVTIQAKDTKSAVFTVNSNGAGSSIKNFKLTKSSYCIIINNAKNCLISGNTITEASHVGIQFYGNIYNCTVANSKIYGQNPKTGNGINSACTLSIISYNNIYNNKKTGLTITGHRAYIYKNLLNGNGEAGLTITGKYNVVTENSICNNLYGALFNDGNAAVVNFNRLVGNKYQMYICKTSTTLNALNNWWGSNKGASTILGNINTKKWIVLHLTSIKKVDNGCYNVTADLSRNSAGEILSSKGHIKDGTIIKFCTSHGYIGSSVKTVGGIAVAVLNPSKGVGASSLKISASLDNQTVTKLIYC